MQDLATGDTLAVNATTRFHAASTMKVPVMIELFRRHDAGTLRLDSTVLLRNQFTSIVDGSPFTLDAGDDSDSSLFAKAGQQVTLRELNERMITRSSNLATNAVIELLDPRRVDATAHALGATTMQVRRGVEDTKAFNAGLNNTTSARDLGVLMAALAQDRAASAASCDEMRAILRRQEFNDEIPAGLPKGTPVAHKTGWITATTHDAAIIYPPGRAPYVLVVLTRAIPQRDVAQRLMADISREVWQAVTRH
ncbi:MAG: class A beta-lactamase-related serine hydrolase [Gemmatimonadetes bacterium]|nr:class A beta-lactamase-related serine hydrolase [Gemmatimonadota bacterium]